MYKYLVFVFAMLVVVGCQGAGTTGYVGSNLQSSSGSSDSVWGSGSDDDGDGINNEDDNCISVANADQEDLDGDGIGDLCDDDYEDDINDDGDETVVHKKVTLKKVGGVLEVTQGKYFSIKLEASKGSGTYKWYKSANPKWPAGLELRKTSEGLIANPFLISGGTPIEVTSNKVTVSGKADVAAGEYEIIVEVCDFEDDTNCKERGYKVTVKEPVRPQGGYIVEKPQAIDLPLTISTALKPEGQGYNTGATIGETFNATFTAMGGTGPYSWMYAEVAPDSDVVECDGLSESVPIFGISHQFMKMKPSCEDNEGMEIDCSDGDTRIFKSRLCIKVTDAIGTTATSWYNFKLSRPGSSNLTIKDLKKIVTRVKGDHYRRCGDIYGGPGTYGKCYISISFYGNEYDTGHEVVLASTLRFLPAGGDKNYHETTVPLLPTAGYGDYKLTDITKMEIRLFDDKSTTAYFEAWFDWIMIYTDYYSMDIDFPGSTHLVTNWHADKGYASKTKDYILDEILDEENDEPEWEAY